MSAVSIARMQPGDWPRVRSLRLRALMDSPDAFARTHADEQSRADREWQTRLQQRDAATFIATCDGLDSGITFGAPYHGCDAAAGLYGLWVAPEHRGRGIAGMLVQAVVAWARERQYARVLLDVGDGNQPAIALYQSKGFVATGVTGSLPAPREHVTEHQRMLLLQQGVSRSTAAFD